MSALELFNTVSVNNIIHYTQIKAGYDANVAELESQNTSINGLDPTYRILLTSTLTENTRVISEYNKKIASITSLINKITEVQDMNDNKKTALFTMMTLSGVDAEIFLNTAVEKHEKIYNTCINAYNDESLSDKIKTLLYKDVILKQYSLINRNIPHRILVII